MIKWNLLNGAVGSRWTASKENISGVLHAVARWFLAGNFREGLCRKIGRGL